MNKLVKLATSLLLTLTLASCAHNDPLAFPKDGLPGMELAPDGNGYAFTTARYRYVTERGAEAALFTGSTDVTHPFELSFDNEPIAAIEMSKFRNSTPASNSSTRKP